MPQNNPQLPGLGHGQTRGKNSHRRRKRLGQGNHGHGTFSSNHRTKDSQQHHSHSGSIPSKRFNEAYLKIIRLRDDVLAGNHPNIRVSRLTEQLENTSTTTSVSEDMTKSLTESGSPVPILRKIIAAGNKVKREKIERELARMAEKNTSLRHDDFSNELDIQGILERAQSVYPPERNFIQNDQTGQQSFSENEISPGQIVEDGDDYDPFEGEFEEEIIKNEDSEVLPDAVGDDYSPPAPAFDEFESDLGYQLEHKSRKRIRDRSQSHGHKDSQQIHVFDEVEMQISVNQIQSPLAPQPSHISTLATDIGQSQFESEGVAPSPRVRLPKPIEAYEVPPGYRLVRIEHEEQAVVPIAAVPIWQESSAHVQQPASIHYAIQPSTYGPSMQPPPHPAPGAPTYGHFAYTPAQVPVATPFAVHVTPAPVSSSNQYMYQPVPIAPVATPFVPNQPHISFAYFGGHAPSATPYQTTGPAMTTQPAWANPNLSTPYSDSSTHPGFGIVEDQSGTTSQHKPTYNPESPFGSIQGANYRY